MKKKGLKGARSALLITLSLLLAVTAAASAFLYQRRAAASARENLLAALQSEVCAQAAALRALPDGSCDEAGFLKAVSSGEPNRADALLCKSNGDVLLSSGGGSALPEGGNLLAMLRQTEPARAGSMSETAAALAARVPGILEYSYQNRRYLAAYAPAEADGLMLVSILSADEVTAPVRRLQTGGAALCVIVALTELALLCFLIQSRRDARRRLELYRSIEAGGVFSLAADSELTLLYANDKFYDMLGYDRLSLREKLDNRCIRCVHPADTRSVLSTLESARDSACGSLSWVMRVIASDGGVRYLRLSGVVEHGDGRSVVSGTAEDVTEHERGEAERSASYRRELSYRNKMESAFYLTALYNVTRRTRSDVRSRNVDEENGEPLSLEDFARGEAARVRDEDEDVKHYFLTLDNPSLERRAEKTGEPVVFDYQRAMPDGARRWMHYESRLLREPESGELMAFFYLTDIDEAKSMVRELEEAARTDSATGLRSRDAALAEIGRYLSMEGAGGLHALYMIDIDGFKRLNETLGHERGDVILRDTAEILSRCFRSTDVVGRAGGDEFIVLMKNASSPAHIRRKGQDLLAALQFVLPEEHGGDPVTVSSGVGAAIFREEGQTFEQLISQAESALYRARNAGRAQLFMFEPEEADDGGEAAATGAVSLQTLLEYIDGGVVMAEVDDDITVTYVSPSYLRSFRPAEKDAGTVGERLFDPVLPEDAPALRAAIRESVHSGSPTEHVYRVRKPGGGICWRHMRATRMPDDGSPRPRVAAVISDVTSLKETKD